MYLVKILATAALIIGCGRVYYQSECVTEGCAQPDPAPTPPPTVQSGQQPKDGKDGTNGLPGENGANGTQGPTGSAGPTGSVGSTGVSGTDGANGATGDYGPTGPAGYSVVFEFGPAIGCPAGGVTWLAALDSDRDGLWSPFDTGQQSATVCNGEDGENGLDAPPTPFTPVAAIDPCGNGPGFDEVLLRLNDGSILASFSDNANGKNTRFSLLVPGNYVSTDGTLCYFSVTSAGEVVW